MKDLIINYNSLSSWYHLTGDESYNKQCIKILNQVSKLSDERKDFFNNHTTLNVLEL